MGKNLEYAVRQAALIIGPFRIRATLVLSNAGYDSNVYGTTENVVKDYSVTAGPAFSIYLPIKNRIVFIIYESPQYVYFLETKRERTWNNYLSGQINIALSRIYLSAGAGLSIAREIWSTEIDVRPQRTERSMNGDFLWQFSRRISIQFGFRESSFDYESLSLGGTDIKEALNRTERYLTGSLNLQLTQKVRTGVEYERGQFDFQTPGSPRNSESQSIYGRLDIQASDKIAGNVRIGIKDFRLRSNLSQNYRGIAGDSNILIKLGRTIRLRGSYTRAVQFSAWVGYSYFIETRMGAGASFYLFPKVRIDYGYSEGKNYYPITSLIRMVPNGVRTDNYRTSRIGIYFRIKGKLGFGPTINWWQRDSTLARFSGKRTFVGANLIYDF